MQNQMTEAPGISSADACPLLLDTHVAVWLRAGSSRLKPSILALIEHSLYQGKICLSPISAWEIGMLAAKKKLDLGQSPLVWIAGFVDKFNVTILDITPEIAINSSFLPGKFHGDPADRILVATAMAHTTAILTADKNILSYGKQGFVQVISCLSR